MSSRQAAGAVTRRGFIGAMAAAVGSRAVGRSCTARAAAPEAAGPSGLIARISRSIVWEGRKSNPDWAWFHPRACMVPGPSGLKALMTLQTASGSDYFGPVHWSTSSDLGASWTDPRPVPGLGRRTIGQDRQEGVCDVVPEYHAKTGTVLAIGHNVYYESGHLARPQGPRYPVYIVLDAQGRWSAMQKLIWDDPSGEAIYTCGCSQRSVLPDGRLLIPLSFGSKKRTDRSVTTALCQFDGRKISVEKVGKELRLAKGRGLLEPSLALLDGRHYMTIRAEDGRGYVTSSDDGLDWDEQKAWAWDDGAPLAMSTTQQHWLVHNEGLWLVYTRKAEKNVNVFRWRAPLYAAAVDREKLRLVRSSEQIVFPLVGDGVKDPKHVARMGNFHVTAASAEQSWVTVGECLPYDDWRGDLLLARIHWNRPNRLAPKAG